MFTPGVGLDTPVDGKSMSYDAWQARQINLEFARLSKSGKPGAIKSATIAHGFNDFCKKLEVAREFLSSK